MGEGIFRSIYMQNEITGGYYAAYMNDIRRSETPEDAIRHLEKVDNLFDHIRDNY